MGILGIAAILAVIICPQILAIFLGIGLAVRAAKM